jgi:thiazole synthase ThiGH ThiG subunit
LILCGLFDKDVGAKVTYSLSVDPLVFGGRSFRSRLIAGTGKYTSFGLMKEALEISGAEIVTVAVRRINLSDRSGESLLNYIDAQRHASASSPLQSISR